MTGSLINKSMRKGGNPSIFVDQIRRRLNKF